MSPLRTQTAPAASTARRSARARARRIACPWAARAAASTLLAAALAAPAAAAAAQPPGTPTDGPPATDTAAPPPSPPATARPPSATTTPTRGPASATPAPPAPNATEEAEPAPSASATVVRRSVDERPNLVFDRVKIDPDRPSPGQSFGLDIDLRNVGRARARNVRVSLQSESFLPEGRSSVIWKDGIAPGEERDLETRMRVAGTLQAGTYPIALTVTWEDEGGNPDRLEATIAVEVGGALAVRPLVAITASRVPGRVAPGVPFGVSFDVANTGGREARNVVVVPAGGGALALHGGGESAPITLGPGGTATIALRLVAAEPGQPGAIAQSMELRYDDPDGQRYTDAQPIGLTVTGDGAFGPLPMVAGVSGGEGLHPGDVFELIVDVANAGSQDALRTVLGFGGGASLLPQAASAGAPTLGPFAPLGRGNRVFLGRLAAGETRTVAQRMVVDGGAKPGAYTLEIAFGFADADGVVQSSSDVVTLLVSRAARLEIHAVDAVTETVVQQRVPFAVEVLNAGTATVNVAEVEIDGGRTLGVEMTPRFVGALDAGAADVIDAEIVPRAPAEAAVLTVRVHYLDDFNQRQQVEETFTLRVAEAPPAPEAAPDEAGPAARRPLIVRILRGLFGLGASQPADAAPGGDEAAPPGLERGRPEEAPIEAAPEGGVG